MKTPFKGALKASINRLTYIVTRGRLTAELRAMKLRETMAAKMPGAVSTKKRLVIRATSPETPPRPKSTITQVAPPRATTARCSRPRLPAMIVSMVAEPMMARLATKMGPASRARAPRLTSGGATECGTASSLRSCVLTSSLMNCSLGRKLEKGGGGKRVCRRPLNSKEKYLGEKGLLASARPKKRAPETGTRAVVQKRETLSLRRAPPDRRCRRAPPA